MSRRTSALILCAALAAFGASAGAQQPAQVDNTGIAPLTAHPELLQQLNDPAYLKNLRRMGLAVFSTPFTKPDGFGDGPFDPAEFPPFAFGHRPTLQGNGTLLRVNGLDAQSCNECHTIVSNTTVPPTLGIAGVGGMVQNAIIGPTLIDVGDSFDDRVTWVAGHNPDLAMVADGVADFNGRFANPPFLFGGGGVEMLAKEMTTDLQAFLAQAQAAPAGTVVNLDTHGVSFGYLVSEGGGDVDLDNVEGIGPANIYGVPVNEALVVRPFGRKGDAFTMRDFDRGAMQFHFGIQPVEVVGAGVDEDGDGITDEITIDSMTMLHIFDVTNPRPVIARLDHDAIAGFGTFQNIGCTNCHRPVLKTNDRNLPLAFPEVAEDPSANVYMTIDLRKAGFDKVPHENGVYVPLFSDLKRHDMGSRLAETNEQGDLRNEEFITARLWGIADTAPYLHDGRATTLYEAIEFHGGEAQSPRDAFLALSNQDRDDLLHFLSKLRTPNKPNEELVN